VDWVLSRDENIGILFTPWGEALYHHAYQTAITRLSHAPNVQRVAIQTNLSCRLDWLVGCDRSRVAFWTTYHPTQTERHKFLGQCNELDRLGVSHSVGVVGLKEQFAEIEKLRAELNPATYLWINAYKRDPDYYTQAEIGMLSQIDPLFPLNTGSYSSRGKSCFAGRNVFTVDGDGTMRRCHFVKQPIGNIYAPDFENGLYERKCPNEVCGCHIGYIHLEELDLYSVFGDGILERIPVNRLVSAETSAGWKNRAP
jgi:hypothetical protein